MSPRGKPWEEMSRYERGLEHCERHFSNETLPLAPLTEAPEKRESNTESRASCAVCPWPINDPLPQPDQRPKLVEYVYQSGRIVSFHGDCHAAWLSASREWRRTHPE